MDLQTGRFIRGGRRGGGLSIPLGGNNSGPQTTSTNQPFNIRFSNGQGDYDQIFESLFDEFQRAQEAGEAANEERYQEILGGYQDRMSGIQAGADLEQQQLAQQFGNAQSGIQDLYDSYLGTLMDMTNRWGSDEATVAARENQSRKTQTQQNAVGRGLYNTTAAVGELTAADRDHQRRLNDIASTVGQRRSALQANATGNYASSIADLLRSRNDAMKSGFQRGTNRVVEGGLDTLNFMEAREDQYPDLNQLVELSVLAGEGQLSSGQQQANSRENSPKTWNQYLTDSQWNQNRRRGVAPGLYSMPSSDNYENYLRAWYSNNPNVPRQGTWGAFL